MFTVPGQGQSEITHSQMNTHNHSSIGYHYVLADESHNIKVGFTRHLRRRIASYFQGRVGGVCLTSARNPYEVQFHVIGVRVGDKAWEKDFHKRNQKWRIVGEWYAPFSPAHREVMTFDWDKPQVHISGFRGLMNNAHLARVRNIMEVFGVDEDSILDYIKSDWGRDYSRVLVDEIYAISQQYLRKKLFKEAQKSS